MKAWNYIGLVALTGAMIGACGDDETTNVDPSGTGGSGGTTTTSVTVTSSSSTTVSTSTGMPMDGVCMSAVTFDGDVFDGCLDANCCTDINPCIADMDCSTCLDAGPGGPGCDTNALYQTFLTCFDDSCASQICGTDLAFGSPNLNTCLNGACCTTFNVCELDTACNACLQDPMGTGCDALQIFLDFQVCRDTECPSDICGMNIIFATTYFNDSRDTNYDSVKCAQDNCCGDPNETNEANWTDPDLRKCADPSNDGVLDMNDAEQTACLLCLQQDPQCVAGAVKDSADAFNTCFSTNCP
jgi:hypothetical protein